MKKLLLSVLTLIALFTVALCGCNNENAELKKRLAELEESNVNLAERIEELERENDRFSDMLNELGVQDGEFYTLQQAYDYGWLTQDDLKSIAYYHNGGTEYNEEIMGENYQPQSKIPETLDKTTELSIKQTVINDLKAENFPETLDIEDIEIPYYGAYNGGVAVKLSYSDTATPVYRQDIVAGVKFIYTSYTVYFNTESYSFNNSIVFWKAEDGGIDKTPAKQIKTDYAKIYNFKNQDLQLSVYGEYNGTYVMFIDGPWDYMDVITNETVGGVEFVYGSSRTLKAYNSGKFYSLEQAYENQLLTYADLLDIHTKYDSKQFTVY